MVNKSISSKRKVSKHKVSKRHGSKHKVSKRHGSKRHSSKRPGSKHKVSKRHGSKRRNHKCTHTKCNKLNGGSPCLFAEYPNLNQATASQCHNEIQYSALVNDYRKWQNNPQCSQDLNSINTVTNIIKKCNEIKPKGLSEGIPLPSRPVQVNPVYSTSTRKSKYLYNGRKNSKSKTRSSKKRRNTKSKLFKN